MTSYTEQKVWRRRTGNKFKVRWVWCCDLWENKWQVWCSCYSVAFA